MPYADPDVKRRYQREWMARRRADFFADKECEECRMTEGLQLAHRDRRRKVSNTIWSWSLCRRLLEIAKCRVLCGPCHIEFDRPEFRAIAALRTRDAFGRFVTETVELREAA